MKPIQSDVTIYRYSVAFAGKEEPPKAKKKRLIQQLLKSEPFSKVPTASDGAQVIVSTKKVELQDKRDKFDIEWYPADGEPPLAPSESDTPERTQGRARNTFSLLVELLGTVSLAELYRDTRDPRYAYPLKLEAIQALNILLSHGPSSDPNIAVASQNRFYPFGNHPQAVSHDLRQGLQALRGYFSSVRTSVSRLVININVATGAFYKPGNLLDLMVEFNGGHPARDPIEYKKVAGFVRKLRIETNYMPDRDKKTNKLKPGQKKRRVHVIFDLSKHKMGADQTTFELTTKDGSKKKYNVADYFAQEYKLKLRVPQAPVVNYGSKENPKWIPAELCSVLPGQLAKRLLLGEQTREMITFAARRPFQNAESITTDGVKVTKLLPFDNQGLNTHLQPFGIKVSIDLLTVHGRILAAPGLQYKRKATQPQNGAWNLDTRALGSEPFQIVRPLKRWGIVLINDPIYNDAQRHVDEFRNTLRLYGLNPPAPVNIISVYVNRSSVQNKNIVGVKAELIKGIKDGFKEVPFLFVLLPNDNAVLYDCVKQVCDIELGVPSICNIGSKFSKEKGQAQYFANVIMKFNQKLGGLNHSLSPDKFRPLDEKTIVFGIDVTHPSPGSSESSPSIAGIVASVDKNFSQYPASIRTQEGRKEMVTDLKDMVLERMRLWQKKNQGGLPNKVIIYRDGVSEGQYQTVLNEELPGFTKAFEELYGQAPKPKISLIVVGKRHHTRFYPTKLDDADPKTGNPKPGTVVDRGVTGEKLYDFFLLAHAGLQGTSKPAHYVVLKDDNKLGADTIQTLTHNLCYTFARATRAVSICPPAYYADILCERGRSYLHGVLKGEGSAFTVQDWQRNVHPNLAETMFYL